MLALALPATAICLLGLGGLLASNRLVDAGMPPSHSRYVSSVVGGVAFLVAVLWLDVWMAVALSAGFALFIIWLRLCRRGSLRGVRGPRPGQAWSEITYVLAATASLAVGWGLLGDRWLAFTPIAFLAWGDSAAGIARLSLWREREATLGPSLCMLGACLASAALYEPFWIGVCGAVAAATIERFRLVIHDGFEDNWQVVGVPLALMGLLGAALA